MKPFDFIFWDNDGILVNTEGLYFEATRMTLATIGISFGEDDYRRLFLQEGVGAWHLAREAGLTDDEVRSLKEKRNRTFSELLVNGDILIPEAQTTLERLTPAYRHAVVTSSKKEHFGLIHRKSNLLRYFVFVLVREDYRKSKPDPEPYQKAVEMADCSPSRCLVIEDSERGLQSAKRAGLPCWIVPSTLTRGNAFTGADRILRNIEEIAELLA